MYEKTLYAGWGDMDFNSHMKNTSFLDKSGDVRMMFFAENGFTMPEFVRLNFGPIVMKDEVEYFKEICLLEEIKVSIQLAGLSEDGSRFMLRNEIRRSDGKLAAKVTSSGGWLNLKDRKLMPPPEKLLNAIRSLPKTDDFKSLPSSIK